MSCYYCTLTPLLLFVLYSSCIFYTFCQASTSASFDSAAAYYTAGREVLGYDGWSVDQSLMLSLCSEGAHTYFICGDLETAKSLVTEVIKQDSITIEDKYTAYKIKTQAHYASSEFDEALNTAFSFRKQLDLPTLKNKQASMPIVVKKFMITMKELGERTAEDIADMPDLTDQRVEMGQRMLDLAANISFIAQPSLYPLIIFQMVRASVKHGINASSCEAFAGYGIILW